MNKDQYEKLRENKQYEPLWLELLNASGFAGVLPNEGIVDRRYYPEAIPVQENKMFGVAKPKVLKAHASLDPNQPIFYKEKKL